MMQQLNFKCHNVYSLQLFRVFGDRLEAKAFDITVHSHDSTDYNPNIPFLFIFVFYMWELCCLNYFTAELACFKS